MVELTRERAEAGSVLTVCRWHDLPGHALALPLLQFTDAENAAQWLRDCRADGLRSLALEVLDLDALHRRTDDQIVQMLAAMLVNGGLCVMQGGTQAQHTPPPGHGATPDELIAARLHTTSRSFQFEGQRLRIVRAREWALLRGSEDRRFQVVPHEQARVLMLRLARSSMLSVDESRAVEEAVPLLPALWQPLQVKSGLLLLRGIESKFNAGNARSAAAIVTAPASRPPEEDHWVQIALLDTDDQPVPDQAYKVELPGGEIREGRLDSLGTAYIGGLKVGGACKVCFPQIDATEWRAA